MGGSDKSSNGKQTLVEVAGRNSKDSMYTLRWADSYTSRYPFVWLMDNCRCLQCYSPTAFRRIGLMTNVDPEVKPIKEEIADDGNTLKVMLPNDHTGVYPSAWLRQQQFDKGNYDPISDLKARPWGPEMTNEISTFKFSELLEDNDVLYRWLLTLHEVGFAILTDAPTKQGTLYDLGKRVAYLKPSGYGDTFDIHRKANPSNLAVKAKLLYLHVDLDLHVDLPFCYNCPGLQMWHVIRQFKTSGGENAFSDAAYTAMVLKRDHPEAYKLLTTVPIHHRNAGTDHIGNFHYIAGRPLIEEDGDGNFNKLYYNHQAKSSYMDVSVEKVQDVYRAIKLLNDTLKKNAIPVKLKEGDIVTFNNTRVTHGRNGFSIDTSTTSGETVRYYEGGYVELDEVYSRTRALREEREGELRL